LSYTCKNNDPCPIAASEGPRGKQTRGGPTPVTAVAEVPSMAPEAPRDAIRGAVDGTPWLKKRASTQATPTPIREKAHA